MFNSFAVTLLFFLSIFLWRVSYAQYHWAAISLAPLWFFVFTGLFQNTLDKRRCIMLSIVRKDSKLLWLMTGRVLSATSSLVISALSISGIALYSLFASPLQITILLFVSAASALTYSRLLKVFRVHINELALSWFSAAATIVIISTVFVIPYALFEWSIVERPGYIRLGFDEAMSTALAQLPRRDDLINEAVSVFQLVDSTKLWLASRFTETMTAGVLFAAQSALICLVIATSSVGAASFYNHHIERRLDDRGTQ